MLVLVCGLIVIVAGVATFFLSPGTILEWTARYGFGLGLIGSGIVLFALGRTILYLREVADTLHEIKNKPR